MADRSATAGSNTRLDEMLLRSARFGEVQSKLDAILAAIRGPADDGEAATPGAEAIAAASGPGMPTPAEMLHFLQVARMHPADRLRGTHAPEEVERPVAAVQSKTVIPPAAEEPIADRIARIEGRLSGLSTLEASMRDLVSRFGTIEATHVEPVRQAALVEIRRALAIERAAADVAAPAAMAAVEQVRDELAAVKKEHGEEARRLRSILQSLSASMERVAVRLEGLEESVSPPQQDNGLRGAIVETPAVFKRPLPQPAARRRPLLEAMGLRRRNAAFA